MTGKSRGPYRAAPQCCVFAGPTLHSEDLVKLYPADVLGPAARGDVYRAALAGYRVLLLIDGYFEGIPSVSHKEILFALQSMVVVGCSSMGALRAAELADHGMIGSGQVYQWYRDGQIEADDEVAIVHAPQKSGYRALSVALVNVRYAVGQAEQKQVISRGSAERIVTAARALFYADRNWDQILSDAREENVPTAQLSAFKHFISTSDWDLKRLDAIRTVAALADGRLPPAQAAVTHFEATSAWDTFVRDETHELSERNLDLR